MMCPPEKVVDSFASLQRSLILERAAVDIAQLLVPFKARDRAIIRRRVQELLRCNDPEPAPHVPVNAAETVKFLAPTWSAAEIEEAMDRAGKLPALEGLCKATVYVMRENLRRELGLPSPC